MTLMDKVDEFLATYIRKTKEIPDKKIEDYIELDASDYNDREEKFAMKINGVEITPTMRRMMALTAPFYMKGLRKKCRDSFRSGWDFNKKLPKQEKDIIDEFNKRNDIKAFMMQMKQDAHVYGDGICLIIFVNDQNTKKPDLSLPPQPNAEPYKIKRLDPERAYQLEYKDKYWKKKGIKHLVYEKGDNAFLGKNKVYIHPDRIQLYQETTFAFSKLGISDIDILRYIINSISDIDIATGDLLKWYAYGVREWTKDGASRNDMKEMRKIMEKHPHTIIGNEKYHFNVHDAESVDPTPFYDYVIMAISAVLVMPTHVLKGTEIAKQGAEIGYSDYHKDIIDSQNLVYAPNLNKLYSMLYKAVFKGTRVYDAEVEFNPIYMGETAEAEIDAKRSATAVNLKTAGIIDNEEAREYINKGHIYFDPKKKIEIEDSNKFKKPIEQNPRTEQAVPKKEKEDKSDDNKMKSKEKMSELWDNDSDDIWNDAGKREEYLQEKRVNRAKIDRLKEIQEKINRLKGKNGN